MFNLIVKASDISLHTTEVSVMRSWKIFHDLLRNHSDVICVQQRDIDNFQNVLYKIYLRLRAEAMHTTPARRELATAMVPGPHESKQCMPSRVESQTCS